MQLRGILDKSLGGYLTFRGFAKLEDIANLSTADKNYQRDLIETHQEEIEKFLTSGKNLFFPEVILGCMLAEEEEMGYLATLFETIQGKESFSFNFKKFKFQSSQAVKFQSSEDRRSEGFFRSATMIFQKAHQKLVSTNKPFMRIDGNHRISAIKGLSKKIVQQKEAGIDEVEILKLEESLDKIKKLNIPFCIIVFRDKSEAEKYSRVTFHNINYKSIPLKMEENLRLILDDCEYFPDEELKTNESFGWAYYFARKMDGTNLHDGYANIKELLDGCYRTTFVNLFELLLSEGLIEKDEEESVKAKAAIAAVDTLYANSEEFRASKSSSLFTAFMYYQIKGSASEVDNFKNWVTKNEIYNIHEIKPKSIVSIFDNIASNKMKSIFVAMPFKKATSKNVWKSIRTVYQKLIEEGESLDLSILERKKPVPNRVDKDVGKSKDINQKIREGIEKCDIFIGDLSHSSENVYYEVGYAMAINKSMILLHDKALTSDNVKFDLRNEDRLDYDSGDFEVFEDELEKRIKNIIEEV